MSLQKAPSMMHNAWENGDITSTKCITNLSNIVFSKKFMQYNQWRFLYYKKVLHCHIFQDWSGLIWINPTPQNQQNKTKNKKKQRFGN